MGFENLGIALGAATNEWNNQRRMARDDAAEQRLTTEWQQKQEQYARQQRQQQEADDILAEYKANDAYFAGAKDVPDDQLGAYIQQGITKYNTDPRYKNGMFAKMEVVDGKPFLIHADEKLQQSQVVPVTREMLGQAQETMRGALLERLASVSPEALTQHLTRQEMLGLERRKVGASERTADAAFTNAEANRGYKEYLERQPKAVANGSWVMGDDGKYRQLYNAAGGAGGAGAALTQQIWAANKELNAKFAPQFEAVEKELSAAYEGGNPQAIRAAQAKAHMLQGAYQREMVTKNPSAGGLRLSFPTEPNAKGNGSGLTALGSTGLVTDGQNTYSVSPDGSTLMPVRVAPSTEIVARAAPQVSRKQVSAVDDPAFAGLRNLPSTVQPQGAASPDWEAINNRRRLIDMFTRNQTGGAYQHTGP